MFKSRQTLKNKIKELEDQLQDYKDIDSGKKVDEVKADYEDKIKKLEKDHINNLEDIERDNLKKIEILKHNHSIEVKDLKFDINNFKDEELISKNKTIEELTNKNAVLTKENEMMNQMVDLNADIVDVKDIIN